jgi:hypothetical protein
VKRKGLIDACIVMWSRFWVAEWSEECEKLGFIVINWWLILVLKYRERDSTWERWQEKEGVCCLVRGVEWVCVVKNNWKLGRVRV